MAFNELDKQRIENSIGTLCRKRIAPQLANKIKLFYKIRGNEVLLYESRPHLDDETLWSEISVARCKYDPKSMLWSLYWQRANGKWLQYPDIKPTKDLQKIVDEIDADPMGVFWG